MKKLKKRLFAALIICLPFNLGTFYTHLIEADLIYAYDVLLAVLYIIWFVESNGFSRRRIFWGKMSFPFVLLLLWTLFSAINAIALTITGIGIYLILKAFLIYLYIINHVRTREDLNWMFRWMFVGVAFQGLLGIVQYTTGSSLGLEFLGAVSKRRMAGVTRVRGTIGFPNQFGAWLALQIPIALSLFIFELKKREKFFYGAAALFGILALLLSFSRSAWTGFIVSSFIFVCLLAVKNLLKPKYVLTLLLALIVVVALVVGFWDMILLRFETGATGKYRLVMIEIALDVIKDNFILGVGLHNYKFHQIDHFKFWHPVHNTYLRLAAETGIPGLLFFLMLIITSIRESYAMLRRNDRFVFAAALGCLCSLWAFLVLVNFGPEYQHYEIKFMFWIILGIIVSLKKIYRDNQKLTHSLKQKQSAQMLSIENVIPNKKQIPSTSPKNGAKK